MSLTHLTLHIDQRRAGWLPRAGREAAKLLREAGCHAMAAELSSRRNVGLPEIERLLRLAVTPGSAPAEGLAADHLAGITSGSACAPAAVPRTPQLYRVCNLSLQARALAVDNDVLLLPQKASPYGSILALSVDEEGTETRRWELPLPSQPHFQAACDGRHLILRDSGLGPDGLQALDAQTGKRLWGRRAGGIIGGGVQGQIGAFGLKDGRILTNEKSRGAVICLEAASGDVLWAHDAGRVRDFHQAPCWLHEETLVVLLPAPERCLFAIDIKSGREKWKRLLGEGDPAYALATAESFLLMRRNGRIDRFNLEDGSGGPWFDAPGGGTDRLDFATDGRALVLSFRGAQGGLAAYALDDATPLWRAENIHTNTPCSPPVILGDCVLRRPIKGTTVVATDLQTGAERWRVEVESEVSDLKGHAHGILAQTERALLLIGEAD